MYETCRCTDFERYQRENDRHVLFELSCSRTNSPESLRCHCTSLQRTRSFLSETTRSNERIRVESTNCEITDKIERCSGKDKEEQEEELLRDILLLLCISLTSCTDDQEHRTETCRESSHGNKSVTIGPVSCCLSRGSRSWKHDCICGIRDVQFVRTQTHFESRDQVY